MFTTRLKPSPVVSPGTDRLMRPRAFDFPWPPPIGLIDRFQSTIAAARGVALLASEYSGFAARSFYDPHFLPGHVANQFSGCVDISPEGISPMLATPCLLTFLLPALRAPDHHGPDSIQFYGVSASNSTKRQPFPNGRDINLRRRPSDPTRLPSCENVALVRRQRIYEATACERFRVRTRSRNVCGDSVSSPNHPAYSFVATANVDAT